MRQAARYDLTITEGLAQPLELTFTDALGTDLDYDGALLSLGVEEDTLLTASGTVEGSVGTITIPALAEGRHRYEVALVRNGVVSSILTGWLLITPRLAPLGAFEDGLAVAVTVPESDPITVTVTVSGSAEARLWQELEIGGDGNRNDNSLVNGGTYEFLIQTVSPSAPTSLTTPTALQLGIGGLGLITCHADYFPLDAHTTATGITTSAAEYDGVITTNATTTPIHKANYHVIAKVTDVVNVYTIGDYQPFGAYVTSALYHRIA